MTATRGEFLDLNRISIIKRRHQNQEQNQTEIEELGKKKTLKRGVPETGEARKGDAYWCDVRADQIETALRTLLLLSENGEGYKGNGICYSAIHRASQYVY